MAATMEATRAMMNSREYARLSGHTVNAPWSQLGATTCTLGAEEVAGELLAP